MIKNEDLKPLNLAFIGDAVQTLYVREHFCLQGDYKVNELTRMVKEKVNAGAQSRAFLAIEKKLTKAEAEIARKARNSVKGHGAKNYSLYEYIHATALEALFGYWYINGQIERLDHFLALAMKEV